MILIYSKNCAKITCNSRTFLSCEKGTHPVTPHSSQSLESTNLLLCLQMCLFLTLAFEKAPHLLLSEPLGKQQQHLLEPWSQCRQWPSPECSRLNTNEHHPLKTQNTRKFNTYSRETKDSAARTGGLPCRTLRVTIIHGAPSP